MCIIFTFFFFSWLGDWFFYTCTDVLMIRWINGSDVAFSAGLLSVFVISTNCLWPPLWGHFILRVKASGKGIRNRLTSSLLICPDEDKIASIVSLFYIFVFYYGNERTLLFYWEQALLTAGTGLNLDWRISLALLPPTNTHTHSLCLSSQGLHVCSRCRFWPVLFLTSVSTSDFYPRVR